MGMSKKKLSKRSYLIQASISFCRSFTLFIASVRSGKFAESPDSDLEILELDLCRTNLREKEFFIYCSVGDKRAVMRKTLLCEFSRVFSSFQL